MSYAHALRLKRQGRAKFECQDAIRLLPRTVHQFIEQDMETRARRSAENLSHDRAVHERCRAESQINWRGEKAPSKKIWPPGRVRS